MAQIHRRCGSSRRQSRPLVRRRGYAVLPHLDRRRSLLHSAVTNARARADRVAFLIRELDERKSMRDRLGKPAQDRDDHGRAGRDTRQLGDTVGTTRYLDAPRYTSMSVSRSAESRRGSAFCSQNLLSTDQKVWGSNPYRRTDGPRLTCRFAGVLVIFGPRIRLT